MSDRKYRQRGYQDEPKAGERSGPKPEPPPREFRVPNVPGFKQTVRCTRCGNSVAATIRRDDRCSRCGVDLWSCVQCQSFDPGARFQCRQAIPVRITPKDARNDCGFFAPTVRVERETGSTAPTDARKAFDDLFK